MKNATFYLLNNNHKFSDGLTVVEQLACYLATQKWRAGKRVLIACEDNIQALKLDDALWSFDSEAFVPHNLAGEGPRDGAPVEICWSQRHGNTPRDLLISLLPDCADFASTYYEVIDFVPDEDALKKLARNRYKAYRSVGFLITTATPPTQ
ncbi:DNA polymerase III subunit chi [Candidatus Hoaglandella endobia]|uniref:DNA polymerase III subunit chi n=1 Tax=Candidatus Hoaglandella endobia TaxID=1778263 RepID=A0A143WWF1_9ENTR|nr:DNA polymerase III subunit chi [Candidatus Hoaglandella endobia]CUX97234.1 DNA polymerase III subunit chi [Candidatus Hoaglandella endobia]